jgi:hypothetical protein
MDAANRSAQAISISVVHKPGEGTSAVVAEYEIAVLWFLKVKRTTLLSVSETQDGFEVCFTTSQHIGSLHLRQRPVTSRFAYPELGRVEHVVFQRESLALRELARLEMISFSDYLEHFSRQEMHPQRPFLIYLPEIGLRNPELGQQMFVPFAGVTNQKGWLGCAYSQVALAQFGLKQKLPSITVIEDDAELTSDWRERWKAGRKLVESGELEITSGLVIEMPSLPKNWYTIQKAGTRFFVSDIFSSNLFATLSPSAMAWIADFPEDAHDPNTEAIDCFIQSKDNLRNGVFVPFLATPMAGAKSTLWGFGNRTYESQIELTQSLIDSAQQEPVGGKLVE